MKICIVTPLFPPEIGGPATYVHGLAKRLNDCGHKVTIITLMDNEVDRLSGVSISTINRRGNKLFRQLKLISKILYNAKNSDIIFAQEPATIGLAAVIVGKFLRKPVVLKFVGDVAWEKAFREGKTTKLLDDFLKEPDANKNIIRIQRYVFRSLKHIIVPSNYLKSILMRYYNISGKKISVVHNAVDFDPIIVLSKSKLRKELNLKGKTILSIGRLAPWKGFIGLIEVMPSVIKKIHDANLFITGDGPQKDEIEKIIKKLRLNKHVKLLGRLEHKKTLCYLVAADIFILNSKYEGLSHVLVEALATGTPSIATNICGNPEVVIDGKTGLLVGMDNKKHLQEAIVKLLSNDGLRAMMSKNCKKYTNEYSWDNTLEKTLKVLKENASTNG